MSTIIGPTLPGPYYESVESVWKEIAEEFGDNGISNPIPHFTLYGLDEVNVDALEEALREVAADHEPFTVRTDGLGIFPGNHVYVPVARSAELAALHRDVVRATGRLGTAPTPYYEPGQWFPHIALAVEIDDDRTGDLVHHLLDRDFVWEFTVDNVEVTRLPSEGAEYELVSGVEL